MTNQELKDFLINQNSIDILKIQSNHFVGSIFNLLSKSPKNQHNKNICQSININYFHIIKFLFENLQPDYFSFLLRKIDSNLRFRAISDHETYQYLKEWNKYVNNSTINKSLFFGAMNQDIQSDIDYYSDKFISTVEEHIFSNQLLSYYKCHKFKHLTIKKLIKKLSFNTPSSYLLAFHIVEFTNDNETIEFIKQKIIQNNSVFLKFINHSYFSRSNILIDTLFSYIDIVKFDLNPRNIINIIHYSHIKYNLDNLIHFYKMIRLTNNQENIDSFIKEASKIKNQHIQEWLNNIYLLENF